MNKTMGLKWYINLFRYLKDSMPKQKHKNRLRIDSQYIIQNNHWHWRQNKRCKHCKLNTQKWINLPRTQRTCDPHTTDGAIVHIKIVIFRTRVFSRFKEVNYGSIFCMSVRVWTVLPWTIIKLMFLVEVTLLCLSRESWQLLHALFIDGENRCFIKKYSCFLSRTWKSRMIRKT